VIERVLAYVKKLTLRKKDLFIIQVAKFWSLKREARRGAPLLKRLHLEPWTAATSANHEETEADRLQKLQFMLLLREDLERLRMLAELARKREQQKLRQMNLIRSTLIEGVLFPYHGDLRAALEKIIAFDRSGLFMNPVSRSEVPDYYDVIKSPMDWAKILGKIDDHQYASVEEFATDVNLVCNNAILYNKADTSFHRTALKIKTAAQPLLADLDSSIRGLHRAEAHEAGLSAIDAVHDSEELQLEPSRSMLQALNDYDQERRERTVEEGEDVAHAPLNLVEDLIRQYHTVERPPPHVETPEEEERRLRREAAAAQKEQNRLKMNAAAAEYRKRRKAEKEAAAAAASMAPSSRASSSRLAALQDSDMGERRRSSRSAQGNDDAGLLNDGSSLRRSASLRQVNGNRSTPQTYLRRRRSDVASSGPETGQRSPRGLTVRKLNEHDTFTRFEAGWILPAGTHRARKSMGAEASSSSATATAPSTSRSKSKSGTLQQPDSPAPSSELSDVGDPMVETPLQKHSKKGTPGQAVKKASTRGIDSSPLPTSKGSRRRLSVNETPTTASSVGRGGLAAADKLAGTNVTDPASNDVKTNKKRSRASMLASEDSSTPKRPRRMSEVEAAGASKTPVTNSLERGKPTPTVFSSKKGGRVSVSPATAFPHLTLVWAKVMSYPYYPAAIVDEADESVPAPVAKEGERQKAKAASSSDKSPLHLVRFFDQQKSFGWVRESKLAMMFEDDAIDKGFAEAPKAPRSRQEIEEAMEEAKKSLDV
jgi:NuA3 HAT complex component NTO1